MSELINVKDILFHLINLIILVVACRFLVYKPVSKFMHARQEKIENDLKSIELRKAELDEFEENKNHLMEQARAEATDIRSKGKKDAEDAATEILEKANQQAKAETAKKLSEADSKIENDLRKNQDKVISSAMNMAKNILQKEVSPEDETRMVEELISSMKDKE